MPTDEYEEALQQVEHRPYALPAGRWRLRQRWKNLLFAHWPVETAALQALLPEGLVADTFEGKAWLGVVPFSMDQVQTRAVGNFAFGVPTTTEFHELNLRTYVRSKKTGAAGVFFFSLDCTSLLAVIGARTIFHLPYFVADIAVEIRGDETAYQSVRRLVTPAPRFEATYRPVGPVFAAERGGLEWFLTERYTLFTVGFGRVLVGDIHHKPWPLQRAEAEIRVNELPGAHGLVLPESAPVLHYARELYVNLWRLRGE